ncbi:MAG: hypothetical protein GY754_08655 [bacterium]|nr:hypothetical protein [bacterium]
MNEKLTDESQRGAARVHIESLLLMARYDEDFKKILLEKREQALEESGIDFTPGEKILLTSIGREKLEQTIDEFTVPGITQKSLPNWRAAAAVIMLLTSVFLAGPVCRSTDNRDQVNRAETLTDGWVDEDTYRASSIGMPRRGLQNLHQQRESAKEAAILNAQKRILERFTSAPLEGAGAMSDVWGSYGLAVAKEFGGFVKGGSVIREKYDKEQNCEIVYEVKMKGLRKRVMFGTLN